MALHTHCVSKTLFRQYDKLNGTRTKPVQVFGFNFPLKTRITPAQQTAHNYYIQIHLKILALAIYQTVQEQHGSCTRLLLTIAHLKTALYPRENCTGPVPGPYGFGFPERALIAHILSTRALHGHVGWGNTLLNGIADDEIRREILGSADMLTRAINEIVALVERKEMACNAVPPTEVTSVSAV